MYAYPKALNTFYSWMEGVKLYDGILFDFNDGKGGFNEMWTKISYAATEHSSEM